MEPLSAISLEALRLLFTGDAALWSIIAVSFSVSGTAIVIATPLALVLAFSLAYLRFPGRRALITLSPTPCCPCPPWWLA